MKDNGRNFKWTDECETKVNAIAHDQAQPLRVARRVLKLVGPQGGGYVDAVEGHRVDRNLSLSIQPNQHLQPLQISRHFHLFREQFNGDGALDSLVQFATADLALAEDAVVLLGADAAPLLKNLCIALDNPGQLEKQEGLFDRDQKEVNKPILDSILEGIEHLQHRGQFGDYFVIVSPALYREAYTNRQSPVDAPIYQIKPLLRAKDGFLFSEAAEGKRGVICSGSRGTINLAVPVDAHVENLPPDDNGQPRLRVAQQFRLVVDDRAAREALK
jgi:uncharacterized linocin/CFP29 family protein